MKKILNISKKIDSDYKELLIIVKEIADKLNIPFFVVGASARDFILENYYDKKLFRRTMDLDIGIKVSNWEEYYELYNNLLQQNNFSPATEKQRVKYKNLRLDIIPFGKIADKKLNISWPPEHEIIMNISGFEEVFKYSLNLLISNNPKIIIKSPSLAGLVILKFLSWVNNYPIRKKDAEDILTIINSYEYSENVDRLYNKEIDLLEEEDYDLLNASIILLGKDMKKIADKNTLNIIIKIINDELSINSKNKLLIDMKSSYEREEIIMNKLIKLKTGLE